MKILIVEDDPSCVLTLESTLFELGYSDWSLADNSESAVKLINEEKPDIILMDIGLKGKKNGIELAKEIEEDVPIIFITGFQDKETYTKAKLINPHAYLLKPFSMFTLETAIDTAVQYSSKELKVGEEDTKETEDQSNDIILGDCLFIKNGTVLHKVRFKDILWIQSDGNYSIVQTETKKHALRSSLVKVVEEIPTDFFVRVHKRYIVQIAKIEKIDTADKEIFVGGHAIPLGRTYKEVFLNRLKKI